MLFLQQKSIYKCLIFFVFSTYLIKILLNYFIKKRNGKFYPCHPSQPKFLPLPFSVNTLAGPYVSSFFALKSVAITQKSKTAITEIIIAKFFVSPFKPITSYKPSKQGNQIVKETSKIRIAPISAIFRSPFLLIPAPAKIDAV